VRSDNLAATFEYADAAIIGSSCRHLRSIGVTKPMGISSNPLANIRPQADTPRERMASV